MLIKELRNKLILRSVVYALILLAVGSLVVFLVGYQTQEQQQYTWLKNDIRSLQSKINSLDAQKLEFANAVKVWEGLTPQAKVMQGIQITQAEVILNRLYETYRLEDVSTIFSKPALLDVESMQKEEVGVEVSDNNFMTFSVYSDRQVYAFLEALLTRFSGYIKITSLNLTRLEKPSPITLKLIADGESPALVKVRVDFTWYALKRNVEQDNEILEQAEG